MTRYKTVAACLASLALLLGPPAAAAARVDTGSSITGKYFRTNRAGASVRAQGGGQHQEMAGLMAGAICMPPRTAQVS
jgi:hypothetical protein